jgi:hypothetical protein
VTTGTLVVLGSGEIAPNMVRVYRKILADHPPTDAVMLDTSFGFQENIPQLTAKIVDYFQTSLQLTIEPASFTNYERASELERESFRQRVQSAQFVFAGPGSPSYAMKQWGPLHFETSLVSVLNQGGTVCFSSAAALTLGRYTAPIYELYKVGAEASWLDGLNVLGEFGLNCVVIPHFDNAEGGNHDTRFCYLGERRLLQLESLLDNGVATFGVDEHTAVIIDRGDDSLRVTGRGQAHWRHGSEQRTLVQDKRIALDELRNAPVPKRAASVCVEPDNSLAPSPMALGERVANADSGSIEALAHLVRLASSGGEGRIDPTTLIEGVLAARAAARASGQYELSDQLRDVLIRGGVVVNDTPDGATWSLTAE